MVGYVEYWFQTDYREQIYSFFLKNQKWIENWNERLQLLGRPYSDIYMAGSGSASRCWIIKA